MKVSAIICAAGTGERAGFGKNKLLAALSDAPVLWHTLTKFDIPEIDEVIVTSSLNDYKEISALCAPFGFRVITGGETRTDGVRAALALTTCDIVLIHDGARPYVTKKTITDCITAVKKYGSAVCAVPATDTTAIVCRGVITDIPARETVCAVQTPQGFLTADIKKAYELADGDGCVYTDDSSIYAKYAGRPHIFEGAKDNIKLTFREDFERSFLRTPEVAAKRVGIGADTHAFGGGEDFVTLAGVKIECDDSLTAHSDGDVILHAVTDAVLSGCGLYDIGRYFPDTDEKYRGADSAAFLRQALDMAKGKGLAPVNISVTVLAEKPRLSPHTDRMRASLASICGLDAERIAIAAGTCEKLGFVGEGKGITAYSAVLLDEIKIKQTLKK